MHDEQFREILRFFGLSWSGYRRVRRGVKKRLRAHMLALECRSLKEYLQRLEIDREERQKSERFTDVSVSRFFRDRDLWQALEGEVLPGLILGADEGIRVWSAGCACGEEAYSLKILWQTFSRRFEGLPELELWATDANPVLLERAREGIYPPSSLKELPDQLRGTCFECLPRKNRFVLSASLKGDILWRQHNLVSEDPPSAGFQLIFLRNNLLTYYEKRLQIPAFRRIVSALREGGVLIIGKKERIPPECGPLVPLATCPFAFEKAG
jgi:chemotaxis methyl-accepting protein methylase